MASQALKASFTNTIVKKIAMGITGLFLVFFVFGHMAGNLTFLFGGSDAFNIYAHTLTSLGPLLYLVETVLLVAFLVHIFSGISVTAISKSARPTSYANLKTTGGPSRQTASSRTMIISGVVLLVFTVVHIFNFKYGTYYETTVDGVVMRDLYRLVEEKFLSPVYALSYIAVMVMLLSHMRHGFWSAFQSLGANHPKYSNQIYAIGVALGFIVSFGFIAVPFVVYFGQFLS